MEVLKRTLNKDIYKLYCSFNKRCFSNSSICGISNYNFQNLVRENEN